MPLPNNGLNYYTAAPNLPTDFREDMIRVDHDVNDKIRVFARYTQDAFDQDYVPTLWAAGTFGTVKTRWSRTEK